MQLWRTGKRNILDHVRQISLNHSDRLKILHSLRAMLRECTYLPDPAARKHLHAQIVSRFRAYHPNNLASGSDKAKLRAELIEQRQPTLLKNVRQGLLHLQRANSGHTHYLEKILDMTYGRMGKRRYDLLVELKIPDVPVNQTELEKLSEPSSQNVPQPSSQLRALLRSQALRRRDLASYRSKVPRITPGIPETNSWGRPMPVRRVRNMKRRWYAEVLDFIMPPLPEHEWERLRKLANGTIPWEGLIPRRGTVSHGFRDETVRGPAFKSNPRKLSPRSMRRLWERTFALCPLMRRDPRAHLGWNIKWGDASEEKDIVLRGNTTPRAMFEGVDNAGKLLKEIHVS